MIYTSLENASSWQGCVLAYGHFSTIHQDYSLPASCSSIGQQLVVALIGDCGSISFPFNQWEDRTLNLLGIADVVLLLRADELAQVIKIKPSVWFRK